MRPGQRRDQGRWALLRATLKSSIWPVPVASIAVAVVLGVVLPGVDDNVDSELPGSVTRLVFGGGPEAARAVLASIAGSLITVTSLTFSLTIIALQLASTQGSPRLLRLFAGDRMVHATMGVFLGTFAYTVTVLRTVRAEDGDEPAFVPRIAVTVASVMTLVSVVMLALFLAHLARVMRVETMLKSISGQTKRAILADQRTVGMGPPLGTITRPAEAYATAARDSGFVISVDRAGLIELAAEHDLVIAEERPIGADVIEGCPLAYWWPRAGELSAVLDEQSINDRIREAVQLGFERVLAQDFAFGLRQIIDVALKAVSPGVNDPTTAVHALGHASALLCSIVRRPSDEAVLVDGDGQGRLLPQPTDVSALLELALGQMRHYGAADPVIAVRMLQLLREVAYSNHRHDLTGPISDQVERTMAAVRKQSFDPEEVRRMEAMGAAALSALGGVWVPTGHPAAVLSDTDLRRPT